MSIMRIQHKTRPYSTIQDSAEEYKTATLLLVSISYLRVLTDLIYTCPWAKEVWWLCWDILVSELEFIGHVYDRIYLGQSKPFSEDFLFYRKIDEGHCYDHQSLVPVKNEVNEL